MALLGFPYFFQRAQIVPSWSRVFGCGLLGGIILFSFMVTSKVLAREPVVSSESELKTAFVYQFTKYVSWPVSKRHDKRLVIGVAADDEMVDALSRLDGMTSQGMVIVVVPVMDGSNLKDMDLLYLGKGHIAHENIIEKAIEHHILTISDEDDAIQKGVIIGLYKADSRLRFNINLKIATQSNLKLSSRLLKLAGNLIK